MLASTMQHSTHHHTPKPTTTTTTPTHPNKGHPRDALDGPGRERPPEKTTHQPADVFSGPNSVPNSFYDFWRYVPPSHTPHNVQGVWK